MAGRSHIARRRTDKTGRSIGFIGGVATITTKPPVNEAWVWLTQAMMASPAHRALSINGFRVLFFLCHEHCANAGQENGRLLAPYNQLEQWGCSRSEIAAAIDELVALGWIKCIRGARLEGRPGASRYRLTWLSACDGTAPTNEWKKVTNADVTLFEAQRRQARTNARELKKLRSRSATDAKGGRVAALADGCAPGPCAKSRPVGEDIEGSAISRAG